MTIYFTMPRIDPLQLLTCLSVLLAPNGGIKTKEEVQRIASLMMKFSKKLVSKCIYIQILKSTKTDLLGMFMAAGGWNLTHSWLSDAIVVKNWPLIQELLELLLMCPVNVERLKTNNCPKLIKGLSKDGSCENVRLLASKLVEQWLRIVKEESAELKANSSRAVETNMNSVSSSESKLVPIVVPDEKRTQSECSQNESAVNPIVKDVEDTVDSSTEKKPEIVRPEMESEVHKNDCEIKLTDEKPEKIQNTTAVEENATSEESGEDNNWSVPMGQLPVYKITIRDGKQVLAKVSTADRTKKGISEGDVLTEDNDIKTDTQKNDTSQSADVQIENVQTNNKINSEIKISGPKIKNKTEKNDNQTLDSKIVKDTQKKSKEVQSTKAAEKKSKSNEITKGKVKELLKEKTKEKQKHKIKEKAKESKVQDKVEIEKEQLQLERDNATLAKLIPPPISKLGKIPKKIRPEEAVVTTETKIVANEVKKSPEIKPKKLSISIEVRKPSNDASRPKTVKTFNSKFRSTGLEEEVKPPPSRVVKKSIPLEKKPIKLPILKRPSPPKEVVPPEKKLKPALTDVSTEENKKVEKSGAIKLIPARPKPCFLQESDMFMDALNASSKKEPRKRKRRISNSKDGPESKKEVLGKDDDTTKESTPPQSPALEETKSPPIVKPSFKFYQDTLEADDDKTPEDVKDTDAKVKAESEDLKEKQEEEDVKNAESDNQDVLDVSLDKGESIISIKEENSGESTDGAQSDSVEERTTRLPKGVLIYHHTRKGPKKNVRWKTEKDLEDIHYFELDETERVNVTKTFMDMKQMERSNEREAFLLARKLPQDDIMEEKTSWQPLIPIDIETNLVEPGKNSKEKEIQYAREKIVLQALYFNRSMIPDSPAEPDMEVHATTDPVIIPLDDVTGNPDSINDFQNTPWPEPKPMVAPPSPPPQFPVTPTQFPTFQPPQQFPPQQVFPPQQPIPNAMAPPVGMMVPANMNTGTGDWRTGDGKIVPINEMPMPVDMYNQGMPPMNMGIPPNMASPVPEMNYNMMPEEMAQGGPFPMQGFPMAGPPNMYGGFRGGGQGHNMRGHGMVGGGRGRGSRGHWFNPMGAGGSGGWQRGGRGGRGSWNGPSRTLCKHFRNGYCRQGEKCPFLHPGINGPQY